jgi:hypothetical protein
LEKHHTKALRVSLARAVVHSEFELQICSQFGNQIVPRQISAPAQA